MTATSAGARAFRSAWMYSGADDTSEYKDYNARLGRYAVLWSYYEGQPYAAIQQHAAQLKVDRGLYKAIRSIYNPAGRIGDFWATYLLGGTLKYNPDGGIANSGAFPIITDNDALRIEIANVFRDSNWQIGKQITGLRGSVLGDFALIVRDGVTSVRIENLHPSDIADVETDGVGYVKSYKLETARTDPEDPSGMRTCRYTETATRDGDLVVYKTYRDGSLYAWNDEQGSEWEEPYGFIPLVLGQHHNVGGRWGLSHFHKSLATIDEANDQASKLSDQIRKAVDSPWLFSGVDAPGETPTVSNTSETSIREEVPIIYGPEGASATALVASLDIPGVSAHIASINAEIEESHPELKLVRLMTSGQQSGEAIRAAQAPVEERVYEKRATYDDSVLRAVLMAVSIRGYRKLAPGFDLSSYRAGNMAAQVGDRGVFATSAQDKLALDRQQAETAAAMRSIGYDPQYYLEDCGWSEERIGRLLKSGAYRNLTFAQYP